MSEEVPKGNKNANRWIMPGVLAAAGLLLLVLIFRIGFDEPEPTKLNVGFVVIGDVHRPGPVEGQTLEQVRELLLGEINKLRQGDFDDDLLVSVVNNLKLQYLRGLDKNGARTRQLVNAFINHVDWAQEVGKLDRMSRMTKQQIVDFARRHLNDNFVCVYKRMGEDTTAKKIDKPAITPIPTNRDMQSDFVKGILGETVQPRRDLAF